MIHPLTGLLFMILCIGALLLLFWPEKGLFPRWQQARAINKRMLMEDALKHLYSTTSNQRRPTIQSIAGALHITTDKAAQLLASLDENGLVRVENGDFRLTSQGQGYALNIIRAHRLWERYLADKTGFAESEWHERAERREHALSPEEVDILSAELGNPSYDPHGDPIPTAGGDLMALGGTPLTAAQPGARLRIVHLEDEPEAVYAQLVAEGLYPGMELQLLEKSPSRVRFWAGGDECVLAPIVANNITVTPRVIRQIEPSSTIHLASLQPGECGKVMALSPRCRAQQRRRLLDLGVLPGTLISAEMASPSGDPIAYRIRGALIALRKEQAQLINIARCNNHENQLKVQREQQHEQQ
jgi:DtxR family transcriptional regulator, Mn-dependent transcriptional regulator